MKKIKSLSIVFPLYRDKKTTKIMIERSLAALRKLKIKSEIIIIDDGCPEKSGLLAKKIIKKKENIKIFINKKNTGYGAALRKGILKCKMDWIYLIDGDAEYKVSDLFKLIKLTKNSDIIITYRKKRAHTFSRIIISLVYNFILRLFFRTQFKDVSSGQRLLKRKLLKNIYMRSNSPFFGAELAIKSFYKKYKVREIGVIEYPTRVLSGSSVTIKNIILTLSEMIYLYRNLNFKKNKD